MSEQRNIKWEDSECKVKIESWFSKQMIPIVRIEETFEKIGIKFPVKAILTSVENAEFNLILLNLKNPTKVYELRFLDNSKIKIIYPEIEKVYIVLYEKGKINLYLMSEVRKKREKSLESLKDKTILSEMLVSDKIKVKVRIYAKDSLHSPLTEKIMNHKLLIQEYLWNISESKTADLIRKDLLKIFNFTDSELQEISQFGIEVLSEKDGYSKYDFYEGLLREIAYTSNGKKYTINCIDFSWKCEYDAMKIQYNSKDGSCVISAKNLEKTEISQNELNGIREEIEKIKKRFT